MLTEPLRIVLVADFREDWFVGSSLEQAMLRNGELVDVVQEDTVSPQQVFEACLYNQADLMFYVRTWSLLDSDPHLVDRLNDIGTATASYDLDLYATTEREGHVGKGLAWKCNKVFTTDGGSEAYFNSLGIRHVWCPAAIDRKFCYLSKTTNPKFTHDVIFVGNYSYHSEYPKRRELIGLLRKRYGDRFALFGDSRQTIVRGHELNELYASAKVVVGDSYCIGRHPLYWSDRIYETCGRGGVLVHPHREGLDAQFYNGTRPDGTVLWYDSFDDMFWKIDLLLEDEGRRNKMRENAQRTVSANHLYDHRWKLMKSRLTLSK